MRVFNITVVIVSSSSNIRNNSSSCNISIILSIPQLTRTKYIEYADNQYGLFIFYNEIKVLIVKDYIQQEENSLLQLVIQQIQELSSKCDTIGKPFNDHCQKVYSFLGYHPFIKNDKTWHRVDIQILIYWFYLYTFQDSKVNIDKKFLKDFLNQEILLQFAQESVVVWFNSILPTTIKRLNGEIQATRVLYITYDGQRIVDGSESLHVHRGGFVIGITFNGQALKSEQIFYFNLCKSKRFRIVDISHIYYNVKSKSFIIPQFGKVDLKNHSKQIADAISDYSKIFKCNIDQYYQFEEIILDDQQDNNSVDPILSRPAKQFICWSRESTDRQVELCEGLLSQYVVNLNLNLIFNNHIN
ncbi:hypothetical protein DFA_03533 [Cavenderia fasciculata]|uniref:Uncharacterized protein n=1 Tax=Cavenderia fasciculata TaxID=261658 RepID=F4PHV0_CACFS|nr:uncharacterized protein DFA_03533 [Cavenderia fasciculata]EGG25284.1 hypothetical protein DFA_03533 [Cavenderia fasciculata]|eukprot:XP_004363135.1 hypothetical protein DFA_03533 [Cavenderia fasciculata]